MGVSTYFISMYGIKIPWDDGLGDRIDELDHYEWECDPFILCDGMGGKFMILGPILFNSGSDRWGWEKGDTFKDYSDETISVLWADWRMKFEEKFPGFGLLTTKPPRFITLMHCT